MQPLRWERRPDGLRAPALVCAFKGWNDAGESAPRRCSFLGTGAGAPSASRPSIPRSSSTSSHAPDDPPHRGPHARDRVARDRDLRGARAARAARPDHALRPRALVPLAHLLRARCSISPRRSASSSWSRSARCSPTCPHSRPVGITGVRLRRGAGRAARARAADLRGPDRASSASCTPPARTRACRARRCGPPCRTTSRSSPNPKAALALLRKLEGLIGVTVDASELETPRPSTSARSSRAVEIGPRRAGLRRAPRAGGGRGGGQPRPRRSSPRAT